MGQQNEELVPRPRLSPPPGGLSLPSAEVAAVGGVTELGQACLWGPRDGPSRNRDKTGTGIPHGQRCVWVHVWLRLQARGGLGSPAKGHTQGKSRKASGSQVWLCPRYKEGGGSTARQTDPNEPLWVR